MKIITDSLGFELNVEITVGAFEKLGEHRTFENYDTKLVEAGSPHKINVRQGLTPTELVQVSTHEAYHLFHSIRHLITVGEETQAETFGGLVQAIFNEGIANENPK